MTKMLALLTLEEKKCKFWWRVDLLMNPNRQKSPGSKPIATDINLDDLNELENLT